MAPETVDGISRQWRCVYCHTIYRGEICTHCHQARVELADSATVERLRDAARVREQGGGPKRQAPHAGQDATGQPQESVERDGVGRRPGSSIHLEMLGGLLDVLIQYEHLSTERQIATLECATRILRADFEDPIFTAEELRGGCQGHA